jgi:toxin FitB
MPPNYLLDSNIIIYATDPVNQFIPALIQRLIPAVSAVSYEAVRLRQQKKMSLGDSLVAATALLHRLPLTTRNKTDFTWIPGLQVFNPFDPADFQQIV